MMTTFQYGVQKISNELSFHLSNSNNALLTAQTGSGKTTILPLELAQAPWLNHKIILMLEPRKIAAKMAAWRMNFLAEQQQLPFRVGYKVRGESTCTTDCKIHIVTEAILTRMIQEDPELPKVGLIIFDEFHERSIHADLGLALALDVQHVLREDLRILIMSATLDTQALQSFIPNTKTFTCSGRLYDVELIYCGKPSPFKLIEATVSASLRAFKETSGDILIFLPGMAQIRACYTALESLNLPQTSLFILHGTLHKELQQQAVMPIEGRRKIIISSSVAESSLTIEGISAVVDSCLERYQLFSIGTGMNKLETALASRSSLTQRAGRAGRLQSGKCYRLLSLLDERTLVAQSTPEIERCDLSLFALELAQWGVYHMPEKLHFLTQPPPKHYQHAKIILEALQAVDKRGHLTELGQKIIKLPLSPRLSALLLHAKPIENAEITNVELVTLLSEKDPLPHDQSNLLLRLGHRAYNEAKNELTQQMKRMGAKIHGIDYTIALAQSFPDHIAKQREKNGLNYLLSNGKGVKFFTDDPLRQHSFLIIPIYESKNDDAIIQLACEISLETIRSSLKNVIKFYIETYYDLEKKRVVSIKKERLGALVLSESLNSKIDNLLAKKLLIEQVKINGVHLLPWTDSLIEYRQRITFLHHIHGFESTYANLSDQGLNQKLDLFLPLLLEGKHALYMIKESELRFALDQLHTYDALSKLNQLAPETIEVPSGSKIKIDYSNLELGPTLSVRLQELFGWKNSPTIVDKKISITLKMLSPAMRIVQITQDLNNFWKEGYFFVRKDLRGRYPKHYWPENPLEAQAIKGSKKRKENN